MGVILDLRCPAALTDARQEVAVIIGKCQCMIRGEGEAFIPGVSAQDVFDFVLDPAQYTKADTKMVWVTKLADTEDGMIAREIGKFLGRFKGAVITKYSWTPPTHIDVTLVD